MTVSDRTVLAAYVVAHHEGGGLLAELHRFLRARAPSHLCPARITVVPELARTRSGKVDRRATHDRYQETR